MTVPDTRDSPHQGVQAAARAPDQVIGVIQVVLGIVSIRDRGRHELAAGREVVGVNGSGNRVVEAIAIRTDSARPTQTRRDGSSQRDRQWHPSSIFDAHGLSLT